MARGEVVAYDPPPPRGENGDPLPLVLTTPCGDPWPRPYYFEDGLRKVTPYHFTYKTYCKERWRDKPLLQIFATEFRDRPLEYYVGQFQVQQKHALADRIQRAAIEDGSVTINGKIVSSTETPVRNGEMISHTLHRHEPPVTSQPIVVVHEDDDIMVINKPAGVPVHPAGRYNFNSLIEILRAERGYQWNPLPCNRLDRLTSGIMFLGKHPKAAERMAVQIKDRNVKKEYIARVIGDFPDGDVVCDQPVITISPKLGLNRVRADGKEARTVFKKLAFYPPWENRASSEVHPSVEREKLRDSHMPWKAKGGYSIVRCLPLTGRTHQIRVHLQFLGHPISNDPIYCNRRVFGQDLAAGDSSGTNDEDIITRLSRMGREEVAEAQAYHEELIDEYNKMRAEKMTGEVCSICQTPLYSDPGVHELGIYLHARRYACLDGKWEYETNLPTWARPPAGVDGPQDVTEESDPLKSAMAALSLDKGRAPTDNDL